MGNLMKIAKLAKYLLHLAEAKRLPDAVVQTLRRESYLAILDAVGRDRSDLTHLSDDDLNELCSNLRGSQYILLHPSPFILVSCYHQLLVGIAQYKAVQFTATADMLQAFSEDGHVVHQVKNATYLSESMDYRRALYFVGIADEVLRPHIAEFHWNESTTTIKLNLNQQQVQEFAKVLSKE